MRYVPVLAAILLLITANCEAAQEDVTINDLKQNFKSLYLEKYDIFFSVLNKAKADAMQCKKAREFLEVAPYIEGNAEVEEFFSKAVEEMTIQCTQCFLDALLIANGKTKRIVFAVVGDPLFLEKDMLDDALNKYRDVNKYDELIKVIYLEK